VPIWLAFTLIASCAILWDAGIVLQKLAVDAVPRIGFERGLSASLRSLLGSGRWMAGLAASAAGWGLFAWALAFTPVSVARAVQGSGFVVLALFSLLFLRHHLSPLEWLGVIFVTAGIVILGVAESSAPGVLAIVRFGGLIPAIVICVLVCLAAWGAARAPRIGLPWAVSFSVIAGTLLGLGDVSTKLLLVTLQGGGPAIGSAAAGAATAGAALILTYVSGFIVLSRAYQHGRAILVTAVSDLCSRLVAILVGILALGEALPQRPGLRALTAAGYVGILVGTVFLASFSGEALVADIASGRESERPGTSQAQGQANEGKADPPSKLDSEL